ncbi:hypothetical protein ABIE89_000029 [Bradyrhizobium niftali]
MQGSGKALQHRLALAGLLLEAFSPTAPCSHPLLAKVGFPPPNVAVLRFAKHDGPAMGARF